MTLRLVTALIVAATLRFPGVVAAADDNPVIYEGTPPPEAVWKSTYQYNITDDEPDDWYIEDHPYAYLMDKVRAPNGSWVDNPNITIPPFTTEDIRRQVAQRVPWWIRWYVVGETRAVRKAMVQGRATIIYNYVSPMDYGTSLRAQNIRAQWYEQMRMFWSNVAGRSMMKHFKENAKIMFYNTFKKYVDDANYMKNVAEMNSTEWAAYANISDEEMANIRAQVNETRRDKFAREYPYRVPVELDASVQRGSVELGRTIRFFQPYENYTARYYNVREDLPPPTFPAAISYPWPWRERIALVRDIIVEMTSAQAARANMEKAKNANRTDGQTANKIADRRLNTNAEGDSMGGSGSGSGDDSNDVEFPVVDADKKLAAVDQVARLVKEFHFTTGLPRVDLNKEHYAPVLFPTLTTFLNKSAQVNGSAGEEFFNFGDPVEPEAGIPSAKDNSSKNLSTGADFSSREGVYEAARHFYSFVSVQKKFIQVKDVPELAIETPSKPPEGTLLMQELKHQEKVELVDCSVEKPCLARSGVTVYTPSLPKAVAETFSINVSVATEARRRKRLDWMMHLLDEAFGAERRVLKSGLLAPSTAWYSFYDRDCDLFADNVQGLVNATISTMAGGGSEVKPLTIFDALMYDIVSPLRHSRSYFMSTSVATNVSMNQLRSVPQHPPFSDEEMMDLIGVAFNMTRQLDEEILEYVNKRDADMMHAAIVKATKDSAYYDGRLFGILGFGYLLPSTNQFNVGYRDHKLPESFHLFIRVLTRLQESRLVLPNESLHLAACVAMLRFDIRFYRCTQLLESEKSTATPLTETTPTPTTDTSSPSPPSSTMASATPSANDILIEVPRLTSRTASLLWK